MINKQLARDIRLMAEKTLPKEGATAAHYEVAISSVFAAADEMTVHALGLFEKKSPEADRIARARTQWITERLMKALDS